MSKKRETKAEAKAKAAAREKYVKKSIDQLTSKAMLDWFTRTPGKSPMDKLPTEIRRKIFSYTLPGKTKVFKPLQKKRTVTKVNHTAFRRAVSTGSLPVHDFTPGGPEIVYISGFDSTAPNPLNAVSEATLSKNPYIKSSMSMSEVSSSTGGTSNINSVGEWKSGNIDNVLKKNNNIGENSKITGSALPASMSNPNLLNDLASFFSSNILTASRTLKLTDDYKTTSLICIPTRNKYPRDRENMFLPLLTTNKKISAEVSTILYEEYTFELHIHADGLDFLDLPRLNVLDDYGLIENVLCKEKQFKDAGAFSFRRIKHWRIVLFGGDPADRTAGMRMRQMMVLLVELFEKEEHLTSIEIRFTVEQAGMDKQGTFWSITKDHTGRRSIWESVTNIELITSPLLTLREVNGGVKLALPVEITAASDLAYKHAFEQMLAQPADYIGEGQFKSVVNKAMMDACMDYCLQHGEWPVDSPKSADIPLLTEEDILADAVDSEFEDFDEADYEDEE